MKTLIRILALVCFTFAVPLVTTSCQTAPNARVVQAQTLLAVGQAADAAIALSAQLYRDGRITPAQARAALDFYNDRFQVAYRFASAAARSDLSTIASPDVLALGNEFIALIASFQK